MKKILLFLLLAASLHAETLLPKIREAISHRFEEIHRKHSDKPQGIWYANYLATLLYNRGQNLYYPDWSGLCNEEYFEKTGTRIFRLKKGVPATQALQSLVNDLTIIDCGNATQLVYYLAVIDIIGADAFDAYVAKSKKPLYIATYTKEAPKDSILFDFVDEVTIPFAGRENHRPLTTGQLVYFRNYPGYLKKHPTGDAQGYNALYLGRDKEGNQRYIALWNAGPKTEREVIELLKQRYYSPPDIWDKKVLAKFPPEEKEKGAPAKHEFFQNTGIYTYTFNMKKINELKE